MKCCRTASSTAVFTSAQLRSASGFPAAAGDLLGANLAAAQELGIRMYLSRGSMDLSVKDGGLPPDSVVQTVDEIMADSIRCIEKYHDPSYGSMPRVALAPCSPFSGSAELLGQRAVLAGRAGGGGGAPGGAAAIPTLGLLQGDKATFVDRGLYTLSAAGAMALGIFAATMLFRLLFTVGRAVCSAVRRAH